MADRGQELLWLANQSLIGGRYEETVACADELLELADGRARSQAFYFRARAMTHLQRSSTELKSAWEDFVARSPESGYDKVARAEGLSALARLEYQNQRDLSRTLQAGEFVTTELAAAAERDQVLMLARIGAPLLKVIAWHHFYPDAAALSRGLIDAGLASEAEHGATIDMTAQLYGLIAARQLNELESAAELLERIVAGGDLALRVLDEWLAKLDATSEPARNYQTITAVTVKATVLANTGQASEAVELLLATKSRFAADADPIVVEHLVALATTTAAIQADNAD